MQFAGDPQPFLHRLPPGDFVPGALSLLSPLLNLVEVELPHAGGHERDASGDEPAGRVEPAPVPIGAHHLSL